VGDVSTAAIFRCDVTHFWPNTVVHTEHEHSKKAYVCQDQTVAKFAMPVYLFIVGCTVYGEFWYQLKRWHYQQLASCLIYAQPFRHTALLQMTTPWLAAQATRW